MLPASLSNAMSNAQYRPRTRIALARSSAGHLFLLFAIALVARYWHPIGCMVVSAPRFIELDLAPPTVAHVEQPPLVLEHVGPSHRLKQRFDRVNTRTTPVIALPVVARNQTAIRIGARPRLALAAEAIAPPASPAPASPAPAPIAPPAVPNSNLGLERNGISIPIRISTAPTLMSHQSTVGMPMNSFLVSTTEQMVAQMDPSVGGRVRNRIDKLPPGMMVSTRAVAPLLGMPGHLAEPIVVASFTRITNAPTVQAAEMTPMFGWAIFDKTSPAIDQYMNTLASEIHTFDMTDTRADSLKNLKPTSWMLTLNQDGSIKYFNGFDSSGSKEMDRGFQQMFGGISKRPLPEGITQLDAIVTYCQVRTSVLKKENFEVSYTLYHDGETPQGQPATAGDWVRSVPSLRTKQE